jgi:2-keto-4-pentenoate hydratase/2-oxohepta-3-ene-1,7-dioic acid hydratase in catechol pathway
MQLVSYLYEGKQRVGVIQSGKIFDLEACSLEFDQKNKRTSPTFSFSSMLDLLHGGEAALEEAQKCVRFVQENYSDEEQSSMGLTHLMHAVKLLAPVTNPGKLIAIGGNFPSVGKLSAPDYSVIFLKPASTIIGTGDPILLSSLTTSVAYEVELAVVIGKPAHHVDATQALHHVAGYTLANDLGDRLLEKRTSQWTTGKMFDTFTPMGPVLFTRDELTDTRLLAMETRVNGQLVQKGITGEMFFDVSQLVSYLSHLTSLQTGDIILTGSPKLIDDQAPASVSLKPGDTVRVAIEGLGELVNPVEAEPQ